MFATEAGAVKVVPKLPPVLESYALNWLAYDAGNKDEIVFDQVPVGIVAGDMLVIMVTCNENTLSGNPLRIDNPAGWATIVEDQVAAPYSPTSIFYRRADGTEGAVTMPLTQTVQALNMGGYYCRLSGVTNSNDVLGVEAFNASTASLSIPGVALPGAPLPFNFIWFTCTLYTSDLNLSAGEYTLVARHGVVNDYVGLEFGFGTNTVLSPVAQSTTMNAAGPMQGVQFSINHL